MSSIKRQRLGEVSSTSPRGGRQTEELNTCALSENERIYSSGDENSHDQNEISSDDDAIEEHSNEDSDGDDDIDEEESDDDSEEPGQEEANDDDSDKENPLLSIQEALKTDPEKTSSIRAKVLNISKLHKYTHSKDKKRHSKDKKRAYCIVYIADIAAETRIQLYRYEDAEMPKKNTTYLFKSLKRKDSENNEQFIGLCAAEFSREDDIDIPDEVVRSSKSNEYEPLWNSTIKRSLEDAVHTKENSNIQGKVIKVSALTSVRSGQYKGLPMKHLLLIDTQDMVPVKLTVFSDDAHKQYKVDDFVKATNVYTKEAGLRCRKQSKTDIDLKLIILRESQIPEQFKVMTTDKVIEDSDLEEEEAECVITEVTDIYKVCFRTRRFKKEMGQCRTEVTPKLGRPFCSECQICRPSTDLGRAAKVNIKRDGRVDDEPHHLNQEGIKKIGVLDVTSSSDVMTDIHSKLPYTCQCVFTAGKLVRLVS